MAVREKVIGGNLVTAIYGYWPSFHDSDIVGIFFGIENNSGHRVIYSIISVHHWGQDNPNWTIDGPDCVIDFRCSDISKMRVDINDMGRGTLVDEIKIEICNDSDVRFNLIPLAGFDVDFICRSVEIVGVRPNL